MNRQSQRQPTKPSRTRVTLLLLSFAAMIGISFWNGEPARAWFLIALVIAVAIAGWANMYIRARRIRAGLPPDRPANPRREQRRNAGVILVGLSALGALAIVNAKPGDRLTAGIIVGVAVALVAVLALPGN